MFENVDLLTKDNLIRHIQKKTSNLSEIATLLQTNQNSLILKSFLPLILAYFEASLIDTIKEYLLARPYEILTSKKVKEILIDKRFAQNRNNFEEKQFKEYILEEYLLQIENRCIKDKIKKVRKLLQIEIDLGGNDWEQIRESIARRNCLIHNDLISNETYLKQAGAQAEEKLQINSLYLVKIITILNNFLLKIQEAIEKKYSSNSNIAVIERLWNYFFENQFKLKFNDCWKEENGIVVYMGPSLDGLKGCHSPRTICLWSAWMSFFAGGDLKNFDTIFHVNEKDRKIYFKKLIFFMECFEKISFQSFTVKVYDKP
ncbi:MAG: hypothetical protein KAJ18_03230 [Candidatus Omnitrophica bacterium]|nr:hypothetical protein [Candidatus Omnitrophota bacterium]